MDPESEKVGMGTVGLVHREKMRPPVITENLVLAPPGSCMVTVGRVGKNPSALPWCSGHDL